MTSKRSIINNRIRNFSISSGNDRVARPVSVPDILALRLSGYNPDLLFEKVPGFPLPV